MLLQQPRVRVADETFVHHISRGKFPLPVLSMFEPFASFYIQKFERQTALKPQ